MVLLMYVLRLSTDAVHAIYLLIGLRDTREERWRDNFGR